MYLLKDLLIPVVLLSLVSNSFSQALITGKVLDKNNQKPLVYVNIGIEKKDIGTISQEDGSFTINIPSEFQNDSLTFSMVGYQVLILPILELSSRKQVTIQLAERTVHLSEVVVTAEKSVEKKYGIKRRGAIHFTDGIFKKGDSFEIGQVIHLGQSIAQITSLNLHINSSRPDSANFRVNFYRYDADENIPKQRLIDKSILQRHQIQAGWLKFDLSNYNILLKGDVLAAIEFIPDHKEDTQQIFYEVKLGGTSKSFFRKTSLGRWLRPPHHYCLYVTALNDKHAPDEADDEETLPAFTLTSDFASEPFSFFIRLPKNYSNGNKQTYPVVYLLDGNAYFDAFANSADHLSKKKKISTDPIIVGIGYENAYMMDSLRDRDYTFPIALPQDSFKLSGQGDQFYNFIKSKVVKHIDSNYRTDTTHRTMMGHSLGGYFVLYALHRQQKDSPTFKYFVAASPSIYYHDYYLTEEMRNNINTSDTKIDLYITIGESEAQENESNSFVDLTEVLKTKNVNVHSKTYKNFGHMETAIPTFENGIRRLFK